jgi:hypothetical protein
MIPTRSFKGLFHIESLYPQADHRAGLSFHCRVGCPQESSTKKPR